MKKVNIRLWLTVAVLLVSEISVARAQRPVGDTLLGPSADSAYFPYVYDWLPTSDAREWYTYPGDLPLSMLECVQGTGYCPVLGLEGNGNLREGNQFYTDRPLKILGIAACARAQNVFDFEFANHPEWSYMGILDTTLAGRNTDSLILYSLSSTGPKYLTGGPWRVENPHRHMILPVRDSIYGRVVCPRGENRSDWNGGNPNPVNAALYEVLFDRPEVVTDSFVVAGTANNNELVEVFVPYPNGTGQSGQTQCKFEHRPTRYWSVRAFFDDPEPRMTNWMKVRGGEWMRMGISYTQTLGGFYWRYFNVIIPIIDPDFDTTLCDAVSDVRVADSTDTTLTLMWNGGNDVMWEVEYFEMNTPTMYRVTTTVPMATLTGLRERTNYMARVRGMCEWDTEYGEWSGWVELWTGAHHDNPQQSISNLSRFTQMMPNPAKGEVTVLSSYRLSRVVVYDLGGRAVLEQEDDGLATTFDVSGLAKGVYVVAIHTPAGIATKRLVVGD